MWFLVKKFVWCSGGASEVVEFVMFVIGKTVKVLLVVEDCGGAEWLYAMVKRCVYGSLVSSKVRFLVIYILPSELRSL